MHRLPEGVVDPILKTVSFFHKDRKLVASHDFACHPMSYYGEGRVSADFCGLARRRRQKQEPNCTHLYFNGCGGNIGAVKYNDGSKKMRRILTDRMLAGIVQSEQNPDPQPIQSLTWETHDILPPSNDRFDEEQIMTRISDPLSIETGHRIQPPGCVERHSEFRLRSVRYM
ncbi:MAG: hypothetical protein MK102_17525 [Fuerstiella sp.]|nr:hypothetical protein [Fuerstiella sp.]